MTLTATGLQSYAVVVLLAACTLALDAAGRNITSSPGTTTCVVDKGQHTLEQCLADQAVTDVVIMSDHAVGNDFAKYIGAPLHITRLVPPTQAHLSHTQAQLPHVPRAPAAFSHQLCMWIGMLSCVWACRPC